MLKTLFTFANLIHLNEFELVYWHIINMQMLQEGLLSRFKFKLGHVEDRLDHELFADLLLASALKAKKLSNDDDEYQIFEEFVFHN